MNVLLIVGIIILLGTFAGKLTKMVKLPQKTGYIFFGLILGIFFQNFFAEINLALDLKPFISLALGIIGFLIGAELDFKRFKRYSRTIYTILFFESVIAFIFVTLIVTFITGEFYVAIMLGALASATAPAATYGILGEYKARGPLTITTLSVIALEDALAIVMFGFASAFARFIILQDQIHILNVLAGPVTQILISILMGGVAVFILKITVSNFQERDILFPLMFGMIILIVGISELLGFEPILASLVLGSLSANLQLSEETEAFTTIKKFSMPIFVLFFVLLGAGTDVDVLAQGNVVLIAIAYIIARNSGKVLGAYLGGKLSKAHRSVNKYLGLCLFDQAGVSVGLALATFNMFSELSPAAHAPGLMILNIIIATTIILQFVSPFMIKFALFRSDEAYRNITEDDIIRTYKVKDVMEEDFFVIKENFNLHQIIDIMKKTDSYYFPVVGIDDKFKGLITLGEIRSAFHEEQMDFLVVASDIVTKMEHVVCFDQPLKEAMRIFRTRKTDYIPVLASEEDRRLVGQLTYKSLRDRITKEVLLRQKELEKIEETE